MSEPLWIVLIYKEYIYALQMEHLIIFWNTSQKKFLREVDLEKSNSFFLLSYFNNETKKLLKIRQFKKKALYSINSQGAPNVISVHLSNPKHTKELHFKRKTNNAESNRNFQRIYNSCFLPLSMKSKLIQHFSYNPKILSNPFNK